LKDSAAEAGHQRAACLPASLTIHVPKENLLGGPAGHDFTPILASFRLALASMAIGLSRAALEYSRDYAKDRDVFGVKAAQKQAIAFMIAEMATEIEAIRLLTWEAAWMLDNSKEEAKHAYLALVGATDMAMMVTDRAVQILGGHGYIREHPVELDAHWCGLLSQWPGNYLSLIRRSPREGLEMIDLCSQTHCPDEYCL
jgi:alkylation response protein AidB-like acyl-CoA dehydrogenase